MNTLSEPWWRWESPLRHLFFVIALFSPTLSFAQPLFTSPITPLDEMFHLNRDRGLNAQIYFALTAETNVRPLNRKTQAANFSDETAYYRASSVWVLQYPYGRWQFSWERALIDYFEGSTGAGQLYLEIEQKQLSTDTRYWVNATMNRSEFTRWAIAYTGSIAEKGDYRLQLHWTQFVRIQQGDLTGFKEQNRFEGQLYLESTRGVPTSTPQAQGWGIDVFLHFEGTPSWHFWMGVENLWSTIRIERTQAIQARVSGGYLEPDADGFLRAVPLIEGRTWFLSARRTAIRRTFLGFRNTHWGWLGIWDVQARYALIVYLNQHTCVAMWLPTEQLWVGFWQKQWGLGLGADYLRWGRWRSVSLQLAYHW